MFDRQYHRMTSHLVTIQGLSSRNRCYVDLTMASGPLTLDWHSRAQKKFRFFDGSISRLDEDADDLEY